MSWRREGQVKIQKSLNKAHEKEIREAVNSPTIKPPPECK